MSAYDENDTRQAGPSQEETDGAERPEMSGGAPPALHAELTHVDDAGRIRMVDVGTKPVTRRRAVASGFVRMSERAVEALRARRTPKGDPLETCRLAGIMGAKATSTLIPLCHPLQLSHVDVRAALEDRGVRIEAEATVDARTGVEMEALTAVTVAALTVYDMCKAIDREMVIEEVRLDRKSGGRSGDFDRQSGDPSTA
jgi:cyclic pyranopterin monophosphate synthase